MGGTIVPPMRSIPPYLPRALRGEGPVHSDIARSGLPFVQGVIVSAGVSGRARG